MSPYDKITRRMDARHWWMVAKLQESFDEHLSSTHLEEFLCHDDTGRTLSAFLDGTGPKNIIIYSKLVNMANEQDGNVAPRTLVRVAASTISSKPLKLAYFLRNCDGHVAMDSYMDHIFWGEMDNNILTDFQQTLSNVCLPMLENESSWGLCGQEDRKMFHSAVERFLHALPAADLLATYRPLSLPDPFDVERARTAGDVRKETLQLFESFFESWMMVIDSVLEESKGLRSDPDLGPAAESKFWSRRVLKLKAIADQLRSPDPQTMMATLIGAQSKVMKRWRITDSALTDAANEAKDVSRFLDVVSKIIKESYVGTPASILESLPLISTTPKIFSATSHHQAAELTLFQLTHRFANQTIATSVKWLVNDSNSWATQPCDDQLRSRLRECHTLPGGVEDCFRPFFIKYKSVFKMPDSNADANALANDRCTEALQSFVGFVDWLNCVQDLIFTKQQFENLTISLYGIVPESDLTVIRASVKDLNELARSKVVGSCAWQDTAAVGELQGAISDITANLEAVVEGLLSQLLIQLSPRIRRTSTQLLRLLGRFSPVAKRQSLRSSILDARLKAFEKFKDELDVVQKIYAKHKEAPPAERNVPKVTGNILWGRQLLRRIQEPMELFNEVDATILTHTDAVATVKIYNKVAMALLEFEGLWIAKWRAGTLQAKNSLAATLLVEEIGSDSPVLNYDPFFKSILDESTALGRLPNLKLPAAVQTLLLQQTKLKHFHDQLSYMLQSRQQVISEIPSHLRSLVVDDIQDISLAMQPGLISTTKV